MSDKLQIIDFGRALVKTNDLDPIYAGFNAVEMTDAHKARWLLAYWCYYHAGVACYMASRSSVEAFWDAMHLAAVNEQLAPNGERWPRGAERRHFRGLTSTKAVSFLRARNRDPLQLIGELLVPEQPGALPAALVMKRVRQWYGFGEWISFKVADMLERCARINIEFTEAEAMYDAPREGALLAWQSWGYEPARYTGPAPVVKLLAEHFADLKAPPCQTRPLGLQEYETIFCKWKSHLNGHYPLGKDSKEIYEGLESWRDIELAARFQDAIKAACPYAAQPESHYHARSH